MLRWFTLVLWLALTLACRPRGTQTPDAAATATCAPIDSLPLCWVLPPTWQVGPAPPAPPREPESAEITQRQEQLKEENALVLDATEHLLTGRRAQPTETPVAPRVDVYRDRSLPARVSATDYLVANRLAQQRSVRHIRHLEVEPVRRAGRRGFHVRDAFDVDVVTGGQAPVSQQGLLLVDGTTGYVFAVTMLEDDRARFAAEVARWLESISFTSPLSE